MPRRPFKRSSITIAGIARALAGFVLCLVVSVTDARAQGDAAAASQLKDETPKNILVIYSYHTGFLTTPIYLSKITEAFNDNNFVADIFMDVKRVPISQSFDETYETLYKRYQNGFVPDVVIVFDDAALVFAGVAQHSLFAGAPIVFAGVNSRELVDEMSARPDITGVHESVSMDANIDFARKLHPTKLDTLILIGNDSVTSRAVLGQVEAALQNWPEMRLEQLSLSRLTFDELGDRMAAETRENAAFLFGSAFRDASGEARNHGEILGDLASRSSAPVYAFIGPSVEEGATGGVVVSMREQAAQAIAMAKRILAGEPASAIPPVLDNTTVPTVNVVEALRHGLRIDPSIPGLRRVNEPPSFAERHWGALVIVFAAGALGIVGLGVAQVFNLRVQRFQRRLNARLRHEALHDALTGLPNRRYVEAFLSGEDAPHAVNVVFHIDLDRFKSINDTLGHEAGDFVLRWVADLLRKMVPPAATPARIGGDEFLVLAAFESLDAAKRFAKELVSELSEPIPYKTYLCRVGGSVGLAEMLTDDATGLTPFQRADIALQRAKEAGRGGVEVFTPALGETVVADKALVDDIQRGLEHEEFEPFFQLQFCAQSNRIAGVEALARWRHPTRGVLPPSDFLEMAQRCGLTATLDRAILRRAMDVVQDWRGVGFEPLQLSVNVSAKRLGAACLTEAASHPALGDTRLCFELVESIFLDDESHPQVRRIREIQEAGVRIEIDDFGTGHASIVALLKLQPDGMKIDRQFVAAIDQDPKRIDLLRTIIQIGRSLEIDTVAEGVESIEQRRWLVQMGCEKLQGFGLARPMSATDALAFALRHAAAEVA